ncbi:MAG: hypothetical protein K2L38_05485, partial [Dysosmobacter sp.]|nr:hypothetical protein [Dysosmobacter sp.]
EINVFHAFYFTTSYIIFLDCFLEVISGLLMMPCFAKALLSAPSESCIPCAARLSIFKPLPPAFSTPKSSVGSDSSSVPPL